MYIGLNIKDYNIKNIFYSEQTKNTVIENSFFSRIFYSTENINLNGCFFTIDLNEFDDNNILIKLLDKIENEILSLYKNTGVKYLKLKDSIVNQLISKNGKNKNKKIVVKISGIWDNYNTYGLTFKLINIDSNKLIT